MPKKIPAPYKDRQTTKEAEEVMPGDAFYRRNGWHAEVLAVKSNGIYTNIAFREYGQKAQTQMFDAHTTVDVVLK